MNQQFNSLIVSTFVL